MAAQARDETQDTAHCAVCHGTSVGRVYSIFPDQRYAAALNAEALFKAIEVDGALQLASEFEVARPWMITIIAK